MRLPRVALVFAPQGEPSMPHIALPMLKAHLQRQQGVSADLFDLNLVFYRQLLSGDESVRAGLAVLDGRGWSPAVYPQALRAVVDECARFSERHPGYRLSLKNLTLPAWDQSGAGLLDLVCHPGNPFVPFFAPIVERLAAYDAVGLNLSWSGQLLPVFTIAAQLRRAASGLTLILGGSLVAHLQESLLAVGGLIDAFDYLVPHEGEVPLARIVEGLAAGRLPDRLPGAFVLGRRGMRAAPPTTIGCALPPEEIPTPDFAGLPLADYLSPVLALPVMATRGCHHRACAFCDHDHSVSTARRRPAEAVVADFDTLRHRHGARHFAFVDDSLPADVLDSLARRLLERGNADGEDGAFRFLTSTRLDPALDRTVLQRASRAGCHALLFGLESGSQRTLDRMRKGTDLQAAWRILGDAHDAGTITWCFFMVGYPGETGQELQATFDALLERRRVVDVIAGGPFALTRRSPLARPGAMPGLVVQAPAPDFALRCAWQHPETMARETVTAALEAATRRFRGVYPSLPAFVEAHALALTQADYQDRFVVRNAAPTPSAAARACGAGRWECTA